MKHEIIKNLNGNDVLIDGLGVYVPLEECEALQQKCTEQSKVIEHIALAVGEEADPMACHESVDAIIAQRDALAAQVEQLQRIADAFIENVEEVTELLTASGDAQNIVLLVNALNQIADDVEALPTPAQCLAEHDAEVAAKAVDGLKFPTMFRKMWSGGEVQEWLKEEAKLIRQAAKGGE